MQKKRVPGQLVSGSTEDFQRVQFPDLYRQFALLESAFGSSMFLHVEASAFLTGN
jgi:hypothetical protein